MTYGNFKDLNRRTAAEKALCENHLILLKKPKYDRYQLRLASMVYKFFDKKTASPVDKSTSSGTIKNEIISNKQLAGELHKPIIRRFDKRNVHSPFIDNVLGANLADV